jgi:hypothetical protein
VDIELINEQVRLFFSALDEVSITITDDTFEIIEYVNLGFQKNHKYYPLEETVINFQDNASYTIETKLLFEPPQFNKKTLYHMYNSNNALLDKLKKGVTLTENETVDLNNLPSTYLICYLNDFENAIDKLQEAKPFLKTQNNGVYLLYKEAMRILRKVKYN